MCWNVIFLRGSSLRAAFGLDLSAKGKIIDHFLHLFDLASFQYARGMRGACIDAHGVFERVPSSPQGTVL